MIEREADKRQRPDGDRIFDDLHPLFDGPNPKNAALRLVDNGCGEQAARRAVVCDGKSATLDVIGPELLAPRAFSQVIDSSRQTE